MTNHVRRGLGAAGTSPRLHCGHDVMWLPVRGAVLIQLVRYFVGRIGYLICKFRAKYVDDSDSLDSLPL